MTEYTGKAGHIYIEKSGERPNDGYEVWFEDFCILGAGASELEALQNAIRHTLQIAKLVTEAAIDAAECASLASPNAGD